MVQQAKPGTVVGELGVAAKDMCQGRPFMHVFMHARWACMKLLRKFYGVHVHIPPPLCCQLDVCPLLGRWPQCIHRHARCVPPSTLLQLFIKYGH